MIRQIKVARDTAVKARTSAIITLKQLVINAPAELREQLDHLADKALIDRCTSFRPGPIIDPVASAKHALRATARRWLDLAGEIRSHDTILAQPVLHHLRVDSLSDEHRSVTVAEVVEAKRLAN